MTWAQATARSSSPRRSSSVRPVSASSTTRGSSCTRAASRKPNSAEAFDVELEQSYQKLAGVAGSAPVVGSVRGRELTFGFLQGAEKVRVDGVVEADSIVATVIRGERAAKYVATRR